MAAQTAVSRSVAEATSAAAVPIALDDVTKRYRRGAAASLAAVAPVNTLATATVERWRALRLPGPCRRDPIHIATVSPEGLALPGARGCSLRELRQRAG